MTAENFFGCCQPCWGTVGVSGFCSCGWECCGLQGLERTLELFLSEIIYKGKYSAMALWWGRSHSQTLQRCRCLQHCMCGWCGKWQEWRQTGTWALKHHYCMMSSTTGSQGSLVIKSACISFPHFQYHFWNILIQDFWVIQDLFFTSHGLLDCSSLFSLPSLVLTSQSVLTSELAFLWAGG